MADSTLFRVATARSLFVGFANEDKVFPFSNRAAIICTVKPQTVRKCGTIAELVKEGMNIARFNLAKISANVKSEFSWNWLGDQVSELRAFEGKGGPPIGVLMDLGGPKLRIHFKSPDRFREPEGGTKIELKEGQKLVLTTNQAKIRDETNDFIITGLAKLPPRSHMHKDSLVLIGDDLNMLRVTSVENDEIWHCEAVRGFPIHHTDGITFQGLDLDLVRDKIGLDDFPNNDCDALHKALELGADMIGVSFASSNLMARIRKEIERYVERKPKAFWKSRNLDPLGTQLVAKIETPIASRDQMLNDILQEPATSAVMVARGDLAASITTLSVPAVQERIIHLARNHQKPVIVATGLLGESGMREFPVLERPAATDIYNALATGADGLMLSETAQGENPLAATALVRKAIIIAENDLYSGSKTRTHMRALTQFCPFAEPEASLGRQLATADISALYDGICRPAVRIADCLGAATIAATARTGATIRGLCSMNPRQIVLALTTSRQTARRVLLCRGAFPVVLERIQNSGKPANLHDPQQFALAVEVALRHQHLTRNLLDGELDRIFKERSSAAPRVKAREYSNFVSHNFAAVGYNYSDETDTPDSIVVGVMRAIFGHKKKRMGQFPNTIHIFHIGEGDSVQDQSAESR